LSWVSVTSIPWYVVPLTVRSMPLTSILLTAVCELHEVCSVGLVHDAVKLTCKSNASFWLVEVTDIDSSPTLDTAKLLVNISQEVGALMDLAMCSQDKKMTQYGFTHEVRGCGIFLQ